MGLHHEPFILETLMGRAEKAVVNCMRFRIFPDESRFHMPTLVWTFVAEDPAAEKSIHLLKDFVQFHFQYLRFMRGL